MVILLRFLPLLLLLSNNLRIVQIYEAILKRVAFLHCMI